ncbi:MAG: flagella basal body P-ring formation protein FlgA [Desulfuromonadales bacterium]|nr:MAG: flagella basal body P-ring formation protein FlgA [Desulfuromonadales bacterium]
MRFVTLVTVFMMVVGTAAFGAPDGQVVSEARLREAVAEFVRQKTASLGVETSIKRIGSMGDLKLPAGEISFEVAAPAQWEGWGRANLAVIVRVNDRVERNIPVAVEVDALADTVVTLRSLERGDVIGAADVAVQKRDISGAAGKVFRSVDEVVGKRAKNAIRANTPLRGANLERVPLVKSGQLVTIIAENQTMRLTATGKARGNGAEGDIVMVQNLGSLKELPGRVIDAGTVQVDF